MKWARLPFVKSLDEFELKGQNVLTTRQLIQLRELSWLECRYTMKTDPLLSLKIDPPRYYI